MGTLLRLVAHGVTPIDRMAPIGNVMAPSQLMPGLVPEKSPLTAHWVFALKHSRSVLEPTRRLFAIAGVILLLELSTVSEGTFADRLSFMALAALGLATAAGWVELVVQGRVRATVHKPVRKESRRAWLLVWGAAIVTSGLLVQTWFRPGTTIAGGDLVLPNGTAWIGRLFDPWIWGSSTLGEPSQLPLALPWAAVLGLVQAVGGEPELAQRIWYTALFIGAALGILSLLGALRLGPLAASAGAAIYLLNFYVITWVNSYDVYLVALFLVVAIPAALVAAGTGKLSVLWSAISVAATAPLVGYSFFNPPLVGMIMAATVAAPGVVAWVFGREAGLRSLRALMLAAPLLVAASAYWLAPAILHLSSVVPNYLGDISGWTWTESRANILNAFWLNTHWGWNTPEFFPYASAYLRPDLSTAKFVVPALAFSALALPALHLRDQRDWRDMNLRLAIAASTVALVVIVFSTGTNWPGNVVFVPLYNLPFGWVLREPARFLMLVALAYAILVGVVTKALLDRAVAELVRSRGITGPAWRLGAAPLAIGVSLLLGFPMFTGGFVADGGPTLPAWAISARPTHVTMPAYWPEMARFADALPESGAVLVMPPDDWYQMPYAWYYGTDDFVSQMFSRRVLLPNRSGYTPASAELSNAVDLTTTSILHRDWPQVEALITALDSPFILVRGDIVAPSPNHSIVPPADLAAALAAAPNFELIRQIGPLELFRLTHTVAETEIAFNVATINTSTPDLQLLSLLPTNTALVYGQPREGIPSLIQAPAPEKWQPQGDSLVWLDPTTAGQNYRVADLNSSTFIPLDHTGMYTVPGSAMRIKYEPAGSSNTITASITGRGAISNGDFGKGVWSSVDDCYGGSATLADPALSASIVVDPTHGGSGALRIAASHGIACESQKLDWHGGPLLLSVMVANLQGNPPRICLWEAGPDRCASMPPIQRSKGWGTFQSSVVPDLGTKSLMLYLYADGGGPLGRTINEYADVRVLEVAALPNLYVLAEPRSAPQTKLLLFHDTFSTKWQGPSGSQHVLVDGLLNGWLLPVASQASSATYWPARLLLAANATSLVTLMTILALAIPRLTGAFVRLRRSRTHRGNPRF